MTGKAWGYISCKHASSIFGATLENCALKTTTKKRAMCAVINILKIELYTVFCCVGEGLSC